MRALKSIVIIMGVLIVAGMVAVSIGIYQKTSSPVTDEVTDEVTDGAKVRKSAGGAKSFGDIALSIGAGCMVTQLLAEDWRLYVHVGPAGPCERIIVFDAAGGKVLGTLRVQP